MRLAWTFPHFKSSSMKWFDMESELLLQGLRLHLDFSGTRSRRRATAGGSVDYAYADSAWASAYSAVAAGAALVAGFGVLAYLKRAGNN